MSLLRIGHEAPDFTAAAHTGESIRLSNFAGRPVVLWFYPAAGTPG